MGKIDLEGKQGYYERLVYVVKRLVMYVTTQDCEN